MINQTNYDGTTIPRMSANSGLTREYFSRVALIGYGYYLLPNSFL